MKNYYTKFYTLILLLALALPSFGQIFITELADPNNNSGARFVELFNAGDSDVDLSTGWSIQRYTNGNTDPQDSVYLSGTIPAKGFYIISPNSTEFNTVYSFLPNQDIGTGGPADSNGDDNIRLIDDEGTIVDIFGLPGEDGSGTAHEFEDGRAERKESVTTGSSVWDAEEWNIDNDEGAGDGALDAPDGYDPGEWIGNIIPDTEAPVFTSGYPSTSSVLDTRINLNVKIDEPGYIYYTVLADGSTAPSIAEIMADQSFEVEIVEFDTTIVISGLTANTAYDIYVIAEDDESTPNVQASATMIDVTTGDPRSLTITQPTNGDDFYLGDTIWFKFDAVNIEAVNLWIYLEPLDEYFNMEKDFSTADDSIAFPLPNEASFYNPLLIYAADALDPQVTSDTLELTLIDEIAPSIVNLEPEDESLIEIPELFSIEFDEIVKVGSNDSIVIFNKADDSVFDIIDVEEDSVWIVDVTAGEGDLGFFYQANFVPNIKLTPGLEYYILISEGAFLDASDNEFPGVLYDTIWNISTLGSDLYFSEYIEGYSSNRALEIYNPTSETVDLSLYGISTNTNGGSWYAPDSLRGTLAPGETYVIINPDFDFTLIDSAEVVDTVWGAYATYFGGDDGRALAKLTSGTWADGEWIFIDQIGDNEGDPGSGWDVAGVSAATQNQTLLRKPGITKGNTNWIEASGTSAEDSEWKVFPVNTFSNLGAPTPEASSETEITNYTIPGLTISSTIYPEDDSISVQLVMSAQLDSLFPVFDLSEGATSIPASGDSVDISDLADTILVTAEDGISKAEWIIKIHQATELQTDADILDISFDESASAPTIDSDNQLIDVYLDYGTDLDSLVPTITLSPGATSSPVSGDTIDFTADTTEIVVIAEDASTIKTWKVVPHYYLIEVNDLAEFKAYAGSNAAFKIKSEVVLTAQMSFMNKKYVQDNSAGVLIFDPDGVITTTYNVGDGITNLIGKIEVYRDVTEFVPVEDPGTASSTGNTITPQVITISEFNNNLNSYESELITIESAEFVDAGTNFANGSNYNIFIEADTTILRVDFYDTDLTGTEIPDSADLTGIAGRYYSTAQLMPRGLADVESLTPVIPKSTNAYLASILVNGVEIEGFDSLIYNYDYTLPANTIIIPSVTWVTADASAGVVPTKADDLPGSTVLLVTAEAGNTQPYTVNFVLEEENALDRSLVNSVKFYPSPVTDYLTVINIENTDRIQVLDITGAVVYDELISSQSEIKIDVQNWNSGMYLIRSISGENINTQRFIKQ